MPACPHKGSRPGSGCPSGHPFNHSSMADALSLLQSIASSGGSDIAYLAELVKANPSRIQGIQTSVERDHNRTFNPTGTIFYYTMTVLSYVTDAMAADSISGITSKNIGCGCGSVSWDGNLIKTTYQSSQDVTLILIRLD